MKSRENGYVYFITQRDNGLVKIGFSCDTKHRLDALKSACKSDLIMVASYPGTRRDERGEHARWLAWRAKGEWFYPNPELSAYIDGINDGQLISQSDEGHKDPWTAKAETWLAYLTEREIARGGSRSPREAHAVIGQHHRIAVGKLYSLSRSRLKEIQSQEFYRLWDAFISEKKAEFREIAAEVDSLIMERDRDERERKRLSDIPALMRALGLDSPCRDPRSNETQALASDIAAVRVALGLPDDGGRK